MRKRATGSRGFSLFELMVVITILLIMMGVSVPYIFRAYRNYQLESAGRQIANIIVRARYESMQRNRRVCAVHQTVSGEDRYGLDLNGPDNDPCDDGAPALGPGEPYMITPTFVQWYAIAPPSTGLPPGYTPATGPPTSFRVTFSPRGTLVRPGAGGTWQMVTTVQMITLIRPLPNEFDAVLVTVTPTGRTKLFRWTTGGNTWYALE